MRKELYFILIGFIVISFHCQPTKVVTTDFRSDWPTNVNRTFIGPDYWTNRLQDWQLKDGRLECVFAGPNRNVNLITRQLSETPGDFQMSVLVGPLEEKAPVNWSGFRFGIQGYFDDYRDSAARGEGIDAGITGDGRLFINDPESPDNPKTSSGEEGILLVLKAEQAGDNYQVELAAFEPGKQQAGASVNATLDSSQVTGILALVSHYAQSPENPDITAAWFKDWQVTGSKIESFPDHAFGPIMWSHYTFSKGILKLSAQMAPVGKEDGDRVILHLQKNGKWVKAAESSIDPMARTAIFKIEKWDNSVDTPYRLTYNFMSPGNKLKEYEWQGTVRREPLDKEEIVVAGFTGNNDLGFPNQDLIKHVIQHEPDVLFFSGDQIYERVGGYGVQRTPVDKSTLDYLRKWYFYGWTYRDMLKDRPSVAMPDDHDVYHGNLWGEGGKKTIQEGTDKEKQDSGGYKQPPEWVNMVQTTQTSHLPDPFDPTPVKQGITVYYTDMEYGGISFAILEDRKFKSAPRALLPKADVINGWAQNKKFNAVKEGDVPTANLLGKRQLNFLQHWAADWSENTWMKVALSQTIFANVATLPEDDLTTDDIVPRLRILPRGEYAPTDVPVADMDSNGWPQSGRNRALRELRKAFVFHYAGDQHLGSVIQYGIDDWNDAGFAFCVPSISNIWPRRWFPQIGRINQSAKMPKYAGDFTDGFGNKITVLAVSNPVFTGCSPALLYDRATGYGITRFNRKTREITLECWPRECDPSKQGTRQYPGWPITIRQMDNYNRKPYGYLRTIEVSGITEPVIQVINKNTREIIYTIRIPGISFAPMVFEDGTYILRIGRSTDGEMKQYDALKPSKEKTDKKLLVEF